MSGIRIDYLNSTVIPTRQHLLPAMHDGMTVKLSVAQILGLLEREDLAEKLFADDVKYDPGIGGPLSAENVQEALDEIVSAVLGSPWATQPIGVPIPLLDNLVGVAAPPTDKGYRYIKLTASDGYNSGVLTGQSVTGTAPLVVATATISLSGSPLNGQTVHLINSEGRVIYGGATAGQVWNDQMQSHTHGVSAASGNLGAGGAQPPPGLGEDGRLSTSPRIDGSYGSPRIGADTRAKGLTATFYMRVL